MPIRARIEARDPLSFHHTLAKSQELDDILKAVKANFEASDTPGYVEHRGIGHSTSQHPLPEKCTIVLIKGAIRLDDEKNPISGTGVAYRTEGSKTLVCDTVDGDSVVVWWPRMCCWKSEECGLARKGRCKRMPGVVFDGRKQKQKQKEECIIL